MIPDGVPPVKVSRQGRGTRSHLTNLQAGIVCDRPTAEMIWSRTSKPHLSQHLGPYALPLVALPPRGNVEPLAPRLWRTKASPDP